MNNQEKKQLYEAIMLDVAKVVKRRINEFYSAETDSDDDVDVITLDDVPSDEIE